MSYDNQIIFPEDGGPIEDEDQQIQFYKASKKEEAVDQHESIDSHHNSQSDLLAATSKHSRVPNLLEANVSQGSAAGGANPYEDYKDGNEDKRSR